MEVYEAQLRKVDKKIREKIMNVTSHWERRGLHKGHKRLALRMLKKRFGSIDENFCSKIEELSAEKLEQLCEALLDFNSIDDLSNWFADF